MPVEVSQAKAPQEFEPPRRWVWDYAMTFVWVLGVLGCTAFAMVVLFIVTIASSIGVDDGANRVPAFLLSVTPIGGLVFLIGGVWFIARRRSKPTSPKTR